MKLQDLLKHVDVVEIKGEENVDITGIFTDSRKSIEGSVFIAFDRSASRWASVYRQCIGLRCEKIVVHQEELDTTKAGITYIKVKDSADAAGKMATQWYGDPSSKLKLVGVTGTNGKTTTATLLYEMFRKLGCKAGLLSTVANYVDGKEYHATHTTPDPLSLNEMLAKMVEAGCDYAFMEVSSHAIHQKVSAV